MDATKADRLIMNKKIRVLFICMGNICRSPTAEGVFRDKVRKAGLERDIDIDSAGTHAYHIGNPPDPRAQKTARGRGYDLSDLRGRQVSERDFETFDYVLAMDRDNLQNLLRLCPEDYKSRVRLYLSFSRRFPNLNVPDPYYGGNQGFEQVLDMVEDAAEGLLADIRRSIAMQPG
jgi:protein-tyrosine phosphatase